MASDKDDFEAMSGPRFEDRAEKAGGKGVVDLPENKMIREPKSATPAWLYLAVIAVFAALVWGGASWFLEKREQMRESNQFAQVTNRDMSLFLWQFPEYMRANVSMKVGYLDGFQYGDKISIEPGMAESYASAPPSVLFLYHTWNRLLGSYGSDRPIDRAEFLEFLEYCPEWKVENWPGAPKEYQALMGELAQGKSTGATLNAVPLKVRQAFTGWKNFFFDKDQINQVKPTYEQMERFIAKYPHYARNDWRNILMKNKPDYLKTLFSGKFEGKETVPENEIAPFLKLGYYNLFSVL